MRLTGTASEARRQRKPSNARYVRHLTAFNSRRKVSHITITVLDDYFSVGSRTRLSAGSFRSFSLSWRSRTADEVPAIGAEDDCP